MVRFSLFCKKGCHIEVARGSFLLMKIKIEPVINEPIFSSQRIKEIFLEDLRYGSDLSEKETFQNWPPE